MFKVKLGQVARERMASLEKGEFVRRIRRGLEAYFANRKLVVVTLLVFAVLLYAWPQFFRSKSRDLPLVESHSSACLDVALDGYAGAVQSGDAAIYYRGLAESERKQPGVPYIPFVGNGHFGLFPADDDQRLRIRHGRALSIPVGFLPLVEFLRPAMRGASAYVTEYRKGTVTHVQCFASEGACVQVHNKMYVHRLYPSLMVQEYEINNPTKRSLDFTLSRTEPSWPDVSTENIGGRPVRILSTQVPVPDRRERFYVLSVAYQQLHSTLTVKAGSIERGRFITALDTSEPETSEVYGFHRNLLESRLKKLLNLAQSMPDEKVFQSHAAVWDRLLQSGFSMSHSKAPDVLNGDLINATMYYVLSNADAPLHEHNIPESSLEQARTALFNPDRCYQGHYTLMYPSSLWPRYDTLGDVVNAAYAWRLTLEKRGGCHSLFEAGADGLLQAMLLSFGALKFTHHHLEFVMDPKDLHRNYLFRNLAFGNGSFVSIAVEVGPENKALLYVWVNNSRGVTQKFYACDAGCLDTPQELSSQRTMFPVKLTDPITPILYITHDKEHIEELKHSIHVKEVAIAPAHEHSVISMHKHGYQLGGLPTIFWVSLALLVTVFHLFLFRIIYNEYCRDEKSYGHSRTRYSA